MVCEAIAMNDDMDQLLGRLTPHGPRAELRPQVLAAVAGQLQADRESRVFRRSALTVAALIVFGIVLNIGLSRASDRRIAKLFGPPPLSKQALEIAEFVGQATDAETGRWVYQQVATSIASSDGHAAYAAYCGMLQRLIAETQRNPRGPKTSNSRPDIRGAADRALDVDFLAANARSPRAGTPRGTYPECVTSTRV
jgi:hypothetical protein